jgi:SH3 domain-containing YSC84-like protein 1
MIQGRHLEQVDGGAGGATSFVGTTENHASHSHMDQCAGTHRAWFLGNVEIAVVQPPISECGLGLRDREHLGVRGGVLEHFHLVESAGDDPAISDDDGADRNFFLRQCLSGQAQSFLHERVVARLVDQVVHVTENIKNAMSKFGQGGSSAPRSIHLEKPEDTAIVLRSGELNITMKTICALLAICFLPFAAATAATEQEVVNQSASILRQFKRMPERGIPRSVMRNAKGLAILTVVKVGFGISGKGGQGVVVARTGNGWSGPSFVGTGGAGWGPQIGAQITEFVFILNSNRAVRAFSRDGNLTLGADASVAAGPVGREAEAAVTPTAAIYTYSRTKGLFAGASLEGTVIATQKTANARYYGRPVSAAAILSGSVAPPARARVLQAALGR